MLYLITGTPGSGKSLFAVSKILEYVEENKKLLEQGKEPRNIYADIDELNIEGVEPAPDDWRDTPDGSVIFYDEIQQRKEFKKSKFDNQVCDDLQIHRHTGHDIYGITQFPVLLHPNFRAVVGMHYHLHRGWGLSSATVFTWAYCVDAPNAPSNKKIAEGSFRFTYPKDAYKYYKSATQHTHKSRIPKKFFILVLMVFLFGYFAVKQLFFKENYIKTIYDKDKKHAKTPPNAPQPTPNEQIGGTTTSPNQTLPQATQIENRRYFLYDSELPKDYQIRRIDPYLQVRGVIHINGKCTAVNAYGDTMNLSYDECLSYVNTGKVYKPDMIGYSPSPSPTNEPTPVQQTPTTN